MKRRDFAKLLAVGVAGGIAVEAAGVAVSRLRPSSRGDVVYSEVEIRGSPSRCLALAGDLEIFAGSPEAGSGTCGLYEALKYLEVFGSGRVKLYGDVYLNSSPPPLSSIELSVEGPGKLFLSPPSVPFALWLSQFLSPSLSLLWYRDVGVVNRVLGRRRALSPSPYLIFPTNNDALIFSRGSQALGQPSAFTASVWISGTPNNNGGYALTYGSLDGGIGWSVRVSDNRVVFLSLSSNAPSSSPFHVAVVYSNGYASLFVNGQLASSGPLGLSYPSQAQLWIGDFPVQNQQAGVNPTNGQNVGEVIIENVQLYSSPLSQSQVEGLASSPSQDPVDYSSLVFWGLYRYIHYLGDLVTGVGFQRMGALLEGGVI
jgi:hypothetical protein